MEWMINNSSSMAEHWSRACMSVCAQVIGMPIGSWLADKYSATRLLPLAFCHTPSQSLFPLCSAVNLHL
eukprot:COSAG05_NODE_107_length_18696_cov_209.227766_17_plen_69_part_00